MTVGSGREPSREDHFHQQSYMFLVLIAEIPKYAIYRINSQNIDEF